MPQTTLHIFHHIPPKQPRVGEMEIALREQLLVSWDEDHLGIKVGADSGVLVKISPCRTRHNQHTVAAGVVFGHT